MAAALTLSDGVESLDLVGTPGEGIWLDRNGFDPPLPAREHTYTDSADAEGRRRIRSRAPNPEGKLRLVIASDDAENFWGYVDQIQELTEAAHRAKGTLRYVPPRDGEPVTFDLEAIRVTGLPQPGVELNALVITAEVEFETRPYGRLDPVTWFSDLWLDGPVDTIVLTGIPGHVDALGELTLTEASSQDREHVEVAVDDDYADSDPLLANLASGLTTTGYAGASTTRAGSYSANVARATLGSAPVALCATTAQPHKGLRRIRARVYASAATVWLRLAWKVGDGPIEYERWVNVPTAAAWYDLNLGVIDIAEGPGTHSWTGYIEAYASSGTATLDVDTVGFMPAARWAAARGTQTPGVSTGGLIAADDFDSHSSGALSTKTAPLGGSWTESGDADDFTIDTTNHWAQRTATADANINSGQFVRLGTATPSVIDIQGDVRVYFDGDDDSLQGIFIRYVNTSNWFFVGYRDEGGGEYSIVAYKYLAASPTSTTLVTRIASASVQWRTLRVVANAAGEYSVYEGAQGGHVVLIGGGTDASLVTAAALDDGGFGFYDARLSSNPLTRAYDNLAVTVPIAAQVDTSKALYSGQSMRFTHEAAYRENAAGTAEGRVPALDGKHFYIPPATRAAEPSRLVVKARRLDVDGDLADSGLSDGLRATLEVTPRVVLLGPADGGS